MLVGFVFLELYVVVEFGGERLILNIFVRIGIYYIFVFIE